MDDFVQCWSNPRIKYFKIRHWNTSCWWRRFLIIASVGKCEQVHTSVLNLIFQQASVAGAGNLSKWRCEISSRCWSAPSFFEECPPQRMTEFLADGPDWHLRSWSYSCLSLFSTVDEWSGSSLDEFHWCNSCGKGADDDASGITKPMCVPNTWRPLFAARRYERMFQHPFRCWVRWEWHWSTGNVGISTAYWFSILNILRIVHTIYFILQFLYSARKFQYCVLILDEFSSCHSVECRTLKFP